MKIDALRRFAHARPFRPFQVSLENGECYAVSHPDYILLGEEIIAIYQREPFDLVNFDPAKITSVKYVRGEKASSK